MANRPLPIDADIVRLQSLCFQHRINVGAALELAGVSWSTWTNWTKGVTPRPRTVRVLEDAITALIAEKEAAAARAAAAPLHHGAFSNTEN